jgi:hypothetical protein
VASWFSTINSLSLSTFYVFRFYIARYSKLRRFYSDSRILIPTSGQLYRITNELRCATRRRGSLKFFAQREILILQSDDYNDR